MTIRKIMFSLAAAGALATPAMSQTVTVAEYCADPANAQAEVCGEYLNAINSAPQELAILFGGLLLAGVLASGGSSTTSTTSTGGS